MGTPFSPLTQPIQVRRMMLPIRIQQFPRFACDVLRRQWVLGRQPTQGATFHLCFFSCQSYFKYLYCSLHSLASYAQNVRLKVLIFSDEEQPLSHAQINEIKKLISEVRVITWPKSMGWGATQISSIWRAYELASESARDHDYIARVDSDVFFFNDRIFRVVERSGADLVGDGHYVDFKYCQGGCYFFRRDAVQRISAMTKETPISELLKETDVRVEDVAAYHFARRLDLKVWLTWFMMFPDELRNAGRLNPWQRWKFSCAHFVMKNKAAMLLAYEREVLGGSAPAPYLQALETP